MSLRKPRVVKKNQLDRLVALLLGEKVTDVSAITTVFLETIRNELAALKDVQLDGLGSLHVAIRKGSTNLYRRADSENAKKYHVTFKKSRPLRRMILKKHGILTEKTMDKLGVDEGQADNEKVASEGCPRCGAKVERHGNVLACPKCGTEPFEKNK